MPSFAVIGVERRPGSSVVMVEAEKGDMPPGTMWLFPMQDGLLESYMEAYALMPGEALELILLDWYEDTVEVPPYMEPGMRVVVDEILTKVDQIDWRCDRDETLAQITVTADTAPDLSAQWSGNRKRNENSSAAYQHRQEELLAEEFVDSMPSVLRSLPRSDEPAGFNDSIEFAIKYVP